MNEDTETRSGGDKENRSIAKNGPLGAACKAEIIQPRATPWDSDPKKASST